VKKSCEDLISDGAKRSRRTGTVPKGKNRLSTAVTTVFILCALLLIDLFMEKVSVTTSGSLKYRVFLKGRPGSPEKGSYVMFHINDRYYDEDVIKKVACMPGEELRVRQKAYSCEGLYLGKAKDKTREGEKLENFEFNGTVPQDRYFVTGSSKDSYDSRYYGFIPDEDIIASAYPLF